MPTTINPSDQVITQYNIQTGGASNLLNNVAPSATSGVAVISQGSSSQPVFGTVVVAGGGTGQTTLTNHGVLVGAATSAITQLAVGNSGQVLQSGGSSADPAYSTATYPAISGTTGKILISDGTNIVSSTPTYPNAASTSLKHIKSDGTNFVTTTVTYPDASVTAGKVIVSDGTNYIASTPTFPNASATSGKIIKSDGTNWLASTETYAAPGTSGNVLTSDGTNWTSATPGGAPSGQTYITITLTNAQIKALHGTPVQVIAAPGAGKAIVPISCWGKLIYGGTNVFIAGASQSISLVYGSGSAINMIQNALNNATIVSAASTYSGYGSANIGSNPASTAVENVAIFAYNSTATEITGNAANNNTISIALMYYVITI
jgi:hypothetical protein